MLKYVVFDFDGTIANSKVVFISAWNQLAKKHHFRPIKEEELAVLQKLTIKERARVLQFPIYKLPIIIPQLYKLYRQSLGEIQLYKGIKLLLNELESRGYKTAIISSNSVDNIKDFLQYNKIESITTVLGSSSIFGKDKLIKKFLRTHRVKASEVIYVGDEQRDIVACKKVGVKVVWVGWGYDAAEAVQFARPDYMVDSPEELLQVIQRLA
jgi:phosphoglycolate phosphatase